MQARTLMTYCLLSWSILGFLISTQSIAQDMRVYTTVTDLTRGQVMSHSLTLFHGGKVYDFMEELGEVVMYEPSQHRFIILAKDYSATEVSFAEINHFLDAARTESLKFIEESAVGESAASAKSAAALRFQLEPEFHETFDANRRFLTMNGGPLNYNVKTDKAPQASYVNQYLQYTDWLARLNYVIHPHSAYPESRLKLNETLRREELLPVEVDLSMQFSSPLRLKAEHSYAWEFQPVDLKSMSHWEKTLRSNQVRWLTFHEYQQRQLARRAQ